MPESMLRLLQWCSFYFFTNPLINVAVTKLSEYPVTNLIFKGPAQQTKRWEGIYRQLKLRAIEIETNLNYFTYGNAFVSLYTPFIKTLKCSGCSRVTIAHLTRSAWRWVDSAFELTCPHCKRRGKPLVEDVPIRDLSRIRVVQWSPEQIDILHNPTTGENRYYYRIPMQLQSMVQMGDRHILETTPQIFLEAIRLRQSVLFSPDRIFHMKRPTIAGKDMGWGLPIIYPLLKDAFYLQIMKKAQETLLMEYVVPMRMIFPGQSGSSQDPAGAYNMTRMIQRLNEEIRNFRIDPNYVMTFPMNVGFQQWGGTGKALILHQEFRIHGEQMLAGAGIPLEFVYGGANWSASNTSLRALANMFENSNVQRHSMVKDFILKQIAIFMNIPEPNAEYEPFRMADDLQQSMHYMQLAQANYIPKDVVLRHLGLNPDECREGLRREASEDRQVNRDAQVAAAQVAAETAAIAGRQQREDAKKMLLAQGEAQAQLAATMPQQAPPPMGGAPAGTQPQPEPAPTGEAPPPAMPAPPPQPQGIIPLGPGPAPAVPVPLAGANTQQADPSLGGASVYDVARDQARELAAPENQDVGTQRRLELQRRTASPLSVVGAGAILSRQGEGSQVNPLDGARNPSPSGSAPQTDPGRRI
jgi:hypothetical protein